MRKGVNDRLNKADKRDCRTGEIQDKKVQQIAN